MARIALIGYGKMGQAIEQLALAADHTIAAKIDQDTSIDSLPADQVDVAIEFSQPDAAVNNIRYCLEKGIPVVSGTTGWLSHYDEIAQLCEKQNGTFFYASNFSVGVNIFFRLNATLAKMMKAFPHYQVQMEETHHIHKKDAPSGTAITLAEGIMKEQPQIEKWVEHPTDDQKLLPILSKREGEVPGTHRIEYISEHDKILIEHEAFSRKGFASGALSVAEWIAREKPTGVLSMEDFMNF